MLSLSDITVGYNGNELISHATTTFAAGTVNLVVGRNGSGKSTLLRSLMGFKAPLSGIVAVNGTDIYTLNGAERSTLISSVTTSRFNIDNLTVKDIVAMGRAPYTNWIGRLQEEDKAIVFAALEDVGMVSFAERMVGSLSDGEYQKVMISRALAQHTPVIILDEPTAFLDIPARYSVCRLLWTLAHERGKCIVYSTHDIDSSLQHSDSVSIIDNSSLSTIHSNMAQGLINSIFRIEP